ncbi:hypothetical protein BC834DRAFT_373026 [Gloeopeniophorella convolvens]|nr:hypothetical protein BC834DRAFT_373026 [Gloeopeniophorella convolvens]
MNRLSMMDANHFNHGLPSLIAGAPCGEAAGCMSVTGHLFDSARQWRRASIAPGPPTHASRATGTRCPFTHSRPPSLPCSTIIFTMRCIILTTRGPSQTMSRCSITGAQSSAISAPDAPRTTAESMRLRAWAWGY